jgi:nitrate reductase cytochrome c-type subunit
MARWLGGSVVLILAFFLLNAGTVSANEKQSFLDTVKTVGEPFDNRSVHQVQPVTQVTVLAGEEYQGGPFRVLARKEQVERYRCSNCHGDKEVKANNAFTLTHGNVVIQHGKEGSALSCIDCHHPQDRDALEDKKGRKIDFDHSYQLCGQCHFRQKRDWLGGAHGKRLANWAGERVVYNCTTCHNPHAPRFAKRFPATYSVPLN